MKSLSVSQALEKARKYCDFQDRYQQELRDKLYAWGMFPEEVESIIATLISENYLNEERFARAFARGKFRIKGWGRIKIKLELKHRKISDYCIKQALKEIDDKEYMQMLRKIIDKKTQLLKSERLQITRQRKAAAYAISRGFEADLVWDIIKLENEL